MTTVETETTDEGRISPAMPSGLWRVVCPLRSIVPGRGATARVAGRLVAVFQLPDASVVAVDDVDPFSGVPILSRGIVGENDGRPIVASPIYKQRFDLLTGECLDDPGIRIRTWKARVNHGRVEVAVP